MRHQREMAGPEIEAFLTTLATERKVSSSTRNQALSAVLFLYPEVLCIVLPWLDGINRPANHRRGVETPHALQAKYPHVGRTLGWFWLFPSPTLSIDPRSGVERRHHLFEERLQKALKKAVPLAGIVKPVSVHT